MADTLQPFAGAAPHGAPGGRLGEARRMQNLSTADVARQLKLSVWQIDALEAGRYEQLPGPIFVRGFIRNYARLVKLDPDDLLRSVRDSLPESPPRPEAPPSRDIPFPGAETPRWPKYAAAATVIFGALATYEFLWNVPEPASQPQVVAQAPIETKPGIERAVAARTLPATQAEPSVAPVVVPAAPAPQVVVPPAEPAGVAEPVPIPAKVASERQIRLVFSEECWVEIRDYRDRVIFSQLNPAGTVQEVSGMPPLSVVVGKAHGTKMTYDGQPVDLARHTKIDVARLTLE